MTTTTIKNFVEQYNIEVQTRFNKAYQELDPKLREMALTYNSGDVSSVDFPISKFTSQMREFDGNRVKRSLEDVLTHSVKNKEWDDSIVINRRDMKRAMSANNTFALDLYTKNIEALARGAKEHPFELMLDMLEAGDANTYGTTFDGQNFFDTTHDFSDSAGTQSNIVTGSGTTLTNVSSDLNSAISAMVGFYFSQGDGNSQKRKLNKGEIMPLVVCPSELYGVFDELREVDRVNNTSNRWRNRFELVSRPMTDTNDWYVLNVAQDGGVKPFLHQVEEEPVLETPNPDSDDSRNHKEYTYGIGGSYGVAYGAWWKAVQVTNT
jgi:phage major head subunit gpT-like protein